MLNEGGPAMMRRNRAIPFCVLLAGTALAVAGCLERKEWLTVRRDGSVEYRIEYRGDPSDFSGGDALPSRRGGWDVRDRMETEDDDEEQVRTGVRRIAPHEPLPDSFAEPGTPEYEAALRFPTTVRIERRRDGVYYHFRRAYEPRALAQWAYYQQAMKERFGLQEGKSWEDMSDQERRKLLEALRWFEGYKHAEYVALAARALDDTWPQDYGLRLRRAVLDYFESADVQALLDLLSQSPSEERDERIARFGDEFVAGAADVLRRELRALRRPRAEVERFFEAYDLAIARHDVTNDLQDETWEVRVTLPGTVVAHNGDDVEGSTVVWTFDAKRLTDRELVLMATSRVAPGASRGD